MLLARKEEMHIRHVLDIDDRPTTEAVDDNGRVLYRGPDAWVRRHAAKHDPVARPERGLSLDELGELMQQGAKQ
jgi:hypothetical protein